MRLDTGGILRLSIPCRSNGKGGCLSLWNKIEMRIRKDHVWRFLALMGASVPALRSDAADASNYLVFSRGPFLMRPRVALA